MPIRFVVPAIFIIFAFSILLLLINTKDLIYYD